MPLYLEHLKKLRADGSSHVSAAFSRRSWGSTRYR